MAVPSEAQNAVDYLRQHGTASNSDVFDGVTYWTDDQLYEILQASTVFKKVYVTPVNKDCTIFIDRFAKHYWLKASSIEFDTTISYTYDENERTFTFTSSPTTLPLLYVTAWNMNHALASLWEQKSAQRYELINVKGGANQLFMEQEYNHCIAQAKKYRSREIRRLAK